MREVPVGAAWGVSSFEVCFLNTDDVAGEPGGCFPEVGSFSWVVEPICVQRQDFKWHSVVEE